MARPTEAPAVPTSLTSPVSRRGAPARVFRRRRRRPRPSRSTVFDDQTTRRSRHALLGPAYVDEFVAELLADWPIGGRDDLLVAEGEEGGRRGAAADRAVERDGVRVLVGGGDERHTKAFRLGAVEGRKDERAANS